MATSLNHKSFFSKSSFLQRWPELEHLVTQADQKNGSICWLTLPIVDREAYAPARFDKSSDRE
ncbi:MAG TPA: hypothetical protein DEQ32_11535 [Gammaproteobacteria bacterium]|nr:hypothetical protein [Gammaproteobacteria bacterium]